ncbi:hypothetical protein E3Q22_03404 [Wallemia mellicola]|uniref:Uncharacterized protein n=2 Tax=Wallemia mellicola TaxID=1708541 RepID=A0A4T0NLV5_9BASI|nr:hypothetical protein WALSEDRAFT_61213 [Wallemia mellicola CBS 633.66]TIB69514.1 hypothetical protein E3Q24_03319 [Wallemia mellicola]EIM20053.1 hypothetical protein WALSEDRAFT_61213 [Wallemia mellicola CBS 633.66]TIB72312.1 hypothetical protein E3Q23_03431 [Wallemia mellicola]TIB76716.1 hypothetical protein E3Q22_03404 [Wallemia mellicola]TIB82335.1 hypothetical protein E3Q21_03417 [Wallemia mellicola]|eukprot:XP_006959982.1 hypothetical protein WALSEDRAFT_61213 [Wallemia mellicola CBS 633.66]
MKLAAVFMLALGSAAAASINTPSIALRNKNHFSLDSDVAAHALYGIKPEYRNEVLKYHRLGNDDRARAALIAGLNDRKAYQLIDKLQKLGN